ncbi:TonB-dependent receptor domain-containing protein, partial [Candidatus Symbiopectobacterium sp. NZEC135]
LSIIPKYTVNTLLEWQATEAFSTTLSWTQYGEQKPRHTATNRIENVPNGLSSRTIGSYAVWGAGASYQVNKNLRVNGGISNLFDKRLYRAADGASTYNEPGRAYYLGVTTSF